MAQYNLDEVKPRETKVQKAEVAAVSVRIQLRKLVAPISGTIVKIDKAEGEWLKEGEPVLEIVQLGVLRVKCKVRATHYSPDQVMGKTATLYMPGSAGSNSKTEEFPGKVVHVDEKIMAGDFFEVFVEVDNRRQGNSWHLQPGRTAAVVIHL